MKKLAVGDSVLTRWDEWDEKGKQVIVPGKVVRVGIGHARSGVYDVEMADGQVEKVFPNQIV